MNDTRDVPKDRQQDVEPELPSKANGQEYADRGQEDRKQDTQKVCHSSLVDTWCVVGTAVRLARSNRYS